jgi:phosphatidylglycerol lysyltransferase
VRPRTLNRLTLAASFAVFLAAAYVLYRNLAGVRLEDMLAQLRVLPHIRVAGALLLTALSYLMLTGYDWLALSYVGRSLPFRKFAPGSFVAFAFSHNIGAAMVSGGSVRYRIYSALGLGPVEIAEIVVFCAFTYALGITTVGGLTLTADPKDVAPILEVSPALVRAIGVVMLLAGLAYLGASALRRQPIRLGRYYLRLPSPASGVAQLALAAADLAVTAGIVYLLLPPDAPVTFSTFLAIYVLAAAAAIMSHVPGGIGVFEAVIVVMLPDVPKAASMGALVAFRCVYFLAPLGLALIGMGAYELGRGKRWLGWRTGRSPPPQ